MAWTEKAIGIVLDTSLRLHMAYEACLTRGRTGSMDGIA